MFYLLSYRSNGSLKEAEELENLSWRNFQSASSNNSVPALFVLYLDWTIIELKEFCQFLLHGSAICLIQGQFDKMELMVCQLA